MAGSVNKVILIGNLGKDPEIRATQDGREIANFSIATSESWKDKNTGDRRDKTEGHNVVVFNEGLVRVAKNYLKKGAKVYIEGQLQTREWEKDGVKRYSTEVVLQNYNGTLTMLDGKREDGGSSSGGYDDGYGSAGSGGYAQHAPASSQNNRASVPAPELDDEIPF
jgi:single-strand DNA-binding protein